MIKNEKIIVIIVFILLVIILTLIYNNKKSNVENNDYDLNIYFFDAGKADAILITKNDKYFMIDTGEESLNKEILRYFQSKNIKKIDYLIITHFDKDHVGSASSIIDNLEIGEVIQSNSKKDSIYYDNYLESLNNKSITPKTVIDNYEININDLSININGTNNTYEKNESNNSSLITSIVYKNNRFLFMGDSENARIKEFLNNNVETYDFMKIPYHGNYLKRLDDLIENTNIKYGVITCSTIEGCEEDTIKVLDKYNVKYYMTKNGSISVLSDGNNIKINQ